MYLLWSNGIVRFKLCAFFSAFLQVFATFFIAALAVFLPTFALATPFTETVPGGNGAIPITYPRVGGTMVVLVGANGNIYYQFVNPSTQFQGFQNTGTPVGYQGNPFQLGPAQTLNCGPTACTTYFGGSIVEGYVRLTARDGDACVGNFDHNDVSFRLNGFHVSSFTGPNTERTNMAGTVSNGFEPCFRDQGSTETSTAWFDISGNTALLNNILTVGSTTPFVQDVDPNDNYWYFTDGNDATGTPEVAPGIEIDKTASSPTYSVVGEVITYTFEVHNIGSVILNNIVVTDANITGAVSCPQTTLIVDEIMFCSAAHTITQDNIDFDITFVNVASVTANPTEGTLGDVSGTVTVTGPLANNSMTVTKSASPTTNVAVGDTVNYTYVITNTGNITLENANITDAHNGSGTLSSITPANATIAPLASQTFTATYIVVQADVDAQAPFTNLATAHATPKRGTITEPTAGASVDVTAAVPSLSMVKSSPTGPYSTVGDILTYSYLVTNTGNVSLTSLSIADDIVDGAGGSVSCPALPATGIAPLATHTCSATYAVTQADIDGGSVMNTATATSGAQTSGPSSVTINADQSPELTLTKSSPSGNYFFVGDTLTYSYVVTNSGNTTITAAISVADDVVDGSGGSVSCPAFPAAGLAPLATYTCSATYDVTQVDIDAGSVTNTASATDGTTTSPDDSVTVSADQAPELTLVKSSPTGPYSTVGDTLTYSYVVTNSGNTTITAAISIADDVIDGSGGSVSCPAFPAAGLAPLATYTCSATYDVTQVDIDAGSVTNTASATDGTTTSPDSSVTISADQAPELTLAKSSPTGPYSTVGDTLTYSYVVTNSGNTTITAAISIADDVVDGAGGSVSCPAFPAAGLAPLATYTCSATYDVTQVDIDAGSVSNTASATDGTTTSPDSSVTINADQSPSLSMVKSSPTGPYSTVGDILTYSYLVTNTGNVSLTSLSIADDIVDGAGGSVSCPALPATGIAPLATHTCSAIYAVTQADIDGGSVVNTATATSGAQTSGPSSVTINADQSPELTLAKSSPSGNYFFVGDTLTYSYVVTNSGNTTITAAISVADDVVDGSGGSVSCPALPVGGLAPLATHTCSATYDVTQVDIDAGSVTNTASATDGTTTSPDSSVTVSADQAPELTLVKSSPTGPYSTVGDTLTYSYVVTNSGNTTITAAISVADDVIDGAGGSVSCPAFPAAGLAPLATYTCSATYDVTQVDIDAGSVTNTASATDGTTTSPDDSVTVSADQAPELTLVKSSPTGPYSTVGDTLTYSYVVTNSGNTTITAAISIADDVVDGAGGSVSCPAFPAAGLAPLATYTCSATYDVTQVDIDAGSVSNTASATDGTTTSPDSSVTINADQSPSLSMVKSSPTGPYSTVGDILTYSYLVTNTGNVSLTSLSIADDIVDGAGGSVSCPALPATGIAPLATHTCSAIYAVTQADIDGGSVVNTATATSGAQTSGPSSVTINADQSPELTLAKSSPSGNYFFVGDTLTYSYVVTNSGNTTITSAISVADDVVDGSGGSVSCPALPVGGLAPLATHTCSATYDVTQVDIDAGSVTNTASATDGTTTSPDSSVTVSADQAPELTLVKSSPTGPYSTVGDTLTYSYVVTNSGNTTITAAISVADDVIDGAGGSVSCPAFPAAGLAPLATYTCSATYDVTQVDIDAGSVTNTASATDGTTTSPDSSVTISADQAPELTLAKSSPTGPYSTVGDTLTYSYVVTNSGNTTITAAISIADDVVDGAGGSVSCPAFPAAGLAPLATYTCSATYDVTQVDIDAGSVSNTASATDGTTTSPDSSVTINADQSPSLSMVKSSPTGPYSTVGDILTYSYLVTNTGNVSLTSLSIADDIVDGAGGSVSCPALPATGIAPLATHTCSAIYAVTQADIDGGSVVNTATATSGAQTSGPSSVTINADQSPELTLAKSSPSGNYFFVGDTLTYSYVVTNSGNTTITSAISVADDVVDGSGGSVSCPALPVGGLAPLATHTCSATYDVTQVDIDAGSVTNTASATDGTTTSPDSSVTVSADQAPELTLVKSSPTGPYSTVGDTLTYSYVVTNSGNTTITAAISVADDVIDGAGGSVSCPAFPAAGLAPLATYTCSATYDVTQVDIDAGSVTNTASATDGTTTSPDSSVTISADQAPELTLAKSSPTGPYSTVGDTLTYSYVVTNSGNTTITAAISIADDVVDGAGGSVSCPAFPAAGLAPLATYTCSATYDVTQVDIDAGSVSNTASATDGTTTSPDSSVTINADQSPSLSMVKSSPTGPYSTVGDILTYSYLVTNTGNVSLTSLSIADDIVDGAGGSVSCPALPATGIAPLATHTCSATYAVTQADIDGGSVMNTATATSGAQTSGPSSVTINADQSPELTLTKSSPSGNYFFVGDTLTYSYVVTNSGNTTITAAISVADDVVDGSGGSVSCPAFPAAGLAPLATYTCSATYDVTQVDIDAGSVTNTASATDGTTTSPDDSVTVSADQAPELTLVKSSPTGPYSTVGDTLTYSYVVTNSGNTTITAAISIADDVIDGSGGSVSCPAFPAAGLAPLATYTCSATYDVTQVDIDAGSVTNTASATDGTTTSPDSSVTISADQAPELTLAKSSPTGPYSTVGDTLTYSYVVTNSGNTTITAAISIADDVVDGAGGSVSCPAFPAAGLAPLATYTCSATYDVTQVDIDAGSVSNTASATDGTTTSPDSSVTINADQSPALTVAKSSPTGPYSTVGDTLTYSYVVTNSGNTTITAALSVADDVIDGAGGSVSCPALPVGGLAPLATHTCSATYDVTQADIDSGSVTNIASATDGTTTSPPDGETVNAVQSPELSMVKSLNAASPTDYSVVGTTLTYDYVVTNSGNTTITAALSVADDVIDGAGGSVSCPALPVGGLAPLATHTCSATYDVTQADIDSGSVTNTASATDGTTTSPDDSVTVSADQAPELTLVKSSPTGPYSTVGDTLTYSYVVTNSGNTTITAAISVADDVIDGAGGSVSCPAFPAAGLAPLATYTCSATYDVTQVDIDAGSVTNTASATDGTTTSPDSSVTISADQAPELTLAKSSPTGPYSTVGDTLTYSYVVTNSGNTTITAAISIADDVVDGAGGSVSCPAFPAAGLAPLATYTCSATYDVTQVDIDAGSVTNTASATDGTTTSPDSSVTVSADQAPELTLVKSSPTGPYSTVGDTLTYSYVVTNSGNTTITAAISVADDVIDGAGGSVSCPAFPAAGLAPLATYTCSATYDVTQVDIDAGSVTNTASATDGTTTSPDSSVTISADQAPELTLVKSSPTGPYSTVGDTLTYSYVVTNSGNTTITAAISVADDVIDGAGGSVSCPAFPAAGLAPLATYTCSATYDVTQVDIDAGSVTNTASATDGTTTSPDDSVTVSADQAPELTLVKSSPTGPYSTVGDTLTYSYVVTNSGNTTITAAISIADDVVDGAGGSVSCPAFPAAGLAPLATYTCSATYDVTQVDIDAGSVSNTASATDGTTTSPDSSVTINADQSPSLSMVKSSPTGPYSTVGDILTYSYLVTNTGNVSLTSLSIADDIVDGAGGSVSCPALPATGIAPLATHTCSAIYAVTQADIDGGSVVNTATATSGAQTSGPSSVTINADQSPELTLAKSSPSGNYFFVGDTLTYSYVVTNSGNTTITSAISVADDVVDGSGGSVSCPALPVGGLAPLATHTCSATYDVTQVDIDAGSVTNTASATDGTTTSPDSSVTVSADQAPELTLVKSSPTGPYSTVGDTLTYSYVVTNSGNTTITAAISVADDVIDGAGGSVSCPAFPAAGLAPLATYTCSATYDVTQVDIDAGSVTNTASATDGTTTSPDSSVTISADQAPELTLAKSSPTGPYSTVGDTLTYSYVVTNSGNTTITAAISIADDVVDGAGGSVSCPAFPAAGLAPLATYTCSATYDVTQADIDSGSVTNIASATDGTTTSPPDGETVNAVQSPELSMVKSLNAASPTDYSVVGTTLTYDYVVTNSGNTTITAALSVADDVIDGAGGSVSCPALPVGGLAPLATHTCSATYDVTQADIDSGSVTNTASATDGTTTSPDDSVTVSADQAPELTLVKSSPTGPYSTVGDTLTYSYVVTNSGNTTITAAISVADDVIDGAGGSVSCPAFPAAGLAPLATYTCSATYDVTQVDIDAGSVTNTASATDGTTTSPDSSVTISADQAPELTLAKSSPTGPYSTVGDTLTYSYVVTNSGNTTITAAISIADDVVDGAGGSVSCPAFPAAGLAPLATYTCSATYDVTQVDIDAGSVSNTASATDGTTTSPDSSVTINADQSPALTVAKSSPTGPYSTVGDTLTYSYVVTNSGNTTITAALSVADDVIDGAGGSVSCPALPVGGLAPLATHTCSATYDVTQADIDSGSVTNIASATDGTTTSPPDGETVNAVQSPELSMVKSLNAASPTDYSVVGTTLTYSYVVTNSGNTTITAALSVADDVIDGAGGSVSCPALPVGGLAPLATHTCSATYDVTQADIDSGSVTNIASATDGTTTSPPDGETVNAVQSPELSMVKSLNAASPTDYSVVGTTLTYDYVVTNSGNTTITAALSVADDVIDGAGGSVSCPALPVGGLAPLATHTCSATYDVTQADIDSGSVTNIASATDGTTTSPPDGETVNAVQSPAMELTKSSTLDDGGDGRADVGDTINYTFIVDNTGNVTITNILIDDPLVTVVGGPIVLAPNQVDTTTFTATYNLVQADIDAGTFANTATVNGLDPNSSVVSDVSDSANPGDGIGDNDPTVTSLTSEPSISLLKVGTLNDGGDGVQPNDTITYVLTVENTGNVTLTGITIVDPLAVVTGGPIDLAPGVIDSTTFTATKTLTQADIDAGTFTNTATVSGDDPNSTSVSDDSDDPTNGTDSDPNGDGNPDDPTTITIPQTPALTIVKTGVLNDGGDGTADVGDVINYTFRVENTGNVSVSGITVSDLMAPVSGGPLTLAPGGVDTASFTASYTLLQSDIDNGSVSNTATASGVDPLGDPVSDVSDSSDPADGAGPDDPTITDLGSAPAIEVTKSADITALSSPAVPGDVINYTFTVTNTGNVTLSNITVSDVGATMAGGPIVSLAPGATDTTTFTASYSITQLDINAGSFSNQALVTGNPPTGPPVTDTSDDPLDPTGSDDPTIATIPQAPAMNMVKTASNVTFTTPGDTADFDYVVTNTGNTSITSPITVTDNLVSPVNCPALPVGGLLPLASITCTGVYSVTQIDLDNGSVTNIATATDGTTTTPIANETIPATQVPALTIAKTPVDTSYAAPGDTVEYSYVLTNSGNLTLTGTTEVVDDKIGTINCFTGNFIPATTQSCTASYTVVQADIDAGSVTNQAYGQNGGVVSPPQSATVNAAQNPSLVVAKTSVDTTFAAVGDVLTYSYLVTNNGNVTITDPIAISDDKVDGAGDSVSCPALPPLGIAPLGTLTCSATYMVTQGDLNTGSVTNIAAATDGTTTSPNTSLTINGAQTPALTIVKTGVLNDGGDGTADVGDVINYTFRVENTGNVSVSGITVSDLMAPVSGGPLTLAPGGVDTASFTASYTLLQSDIDNGSVSNTATASGVDPLGDPVSDVSDSSDPADGAGPDDPTITDLGSAPAIEVTKSADITALSSPAVPGDVINYTFTVTNTGNVTLSNITVSDVGATMAGGPIVSLAPGATDTTTFTASYSITQLDINAGSFSNQALVTGNPPTGPPVTDTSDDPLDPTGSDDPTIATIPQAPAMNMVKTASNVTFTTPGDTADFDYVVTNTGNTSITSPITVTDNLVSPVNCPALPVGGLLPLASITCTGVYSVTQIDLDNGSVTNIATATDGTTTTPIANETIPATQVPALTIAKTPVDTSYAAPGDTVEYSYVLTNSGNLTLTGTTEVVDDKIGTINCFTGNFIPATTQSCTASYTVVQADIDAGSVTNQAYGQNGGVVSPPQSATVNAAQNPSLVVAKTSVDTTFAAVGDVLTYSYLVTNNGNVTITDPIAISDDKVDGAGDSVSCPALPPLGIAPLGTLTCSATYMVTQGDLNTGSVTNIAAATDGTTTSPNTSLTINGAQTPALTIVKTGVLNDGGDGTADVGDVINYTFRVENTGNVSVSGITVSDLMAPVSGGPLTLAPGGVDTASFTASYTLLQSDIDNGSVSNTATASGVDPLGDPVSDVSDSSDPADGAGPDDPTITDLGSAPAIEVTKSADITALSSPAVPGDVINYTFTVTNTGNVTLSNITVSDVGATMAGGPIVSLAPGATDTTTFTASYSITQLDINAGSFSNQALVTGNPPTGPPVTDTSDDPLDPTGSDDPTVATIPQADGLGLTKSIASVTQLYPYVYEVVYSINVENTGNTTLNGIQVEDDILAAMTPGTLVSVPQITATGFAGTASTSPAYDGISNTDLLTGNAILAPNASGVITITVRADFSAGIPTQGNTANGSSDEIAGPIPSNDPNVTPGSPNDTNPTPAPLVDTDNDGSPDGNESSVNDRDGDGTPDAQDYDPTGYFYCEDTGAILAGGLISVVGPLGTQTGIGTSNNITIVRDGTNGSFQFHVSAPGTYSLNYTLPTTGIASTDRLPGAALDVTSFLPANPGVLGSGEIGATGQLSNFTAAANPFHTQFVIEAGDPAVFNNNIPLKFCGVPALTASKSVSGTPVLLPNGSTQVTYALSAENTGSTQVLNVNLTDDLDAAFGAGNHTVTSLTISSAPATFGTVTNTGFNGAADTQLLGPNGVLERGETVVAELVLEIAASASGTFTNEVTAIGTSPLDGSAIIPNTASTDVTLSAPSDITGLKVTKTASRPTVRIGDIISYTISIENTDNLARVNVDLIDYMPAGFTYRPGSATIDTVQTDPVQTGRRLTWAGQTIPANTTVVLTLNMGVGAAAAEHEFTNLAWVQDPLTGQRISTIGKAVVRREFEHVFDCGEIIGKVYDDKNRNGYQDKDEPGLPGVRVATVKGILITSDKHGRYHVPCAAIPDARIGSNFILKLDTRTLPTGYRLTTENPRVVRLTRGKITKLNFGATIHRVVRIDVDPSAFGYGQTKPNKKLSKGIDQLIDMLATEKSVLRISYHGKGDEDLGKSRLRSLSKLITNRWKHSRGSYDLDIETRFVGGK